MADGHGRPIRVLHLISTLDVGGAEQNLLNLLQALPRDSFAHEVVCMTAAGIVGDRIEEAGIHVHSLRMRKGTPDFRAFLRLRSLERRFRPQVVQCWMYHANLLGLILGNPQRILWNIRCSDMDLSLYGPVYRFSVLAGAWLSGFPGAVITNSLAGRRVHERLGYRPKKWVHIPNGFDTEVYRPDEDARTRMRTALGIPEDVLAIGLIARLDPMKDHATFFHGVSHFHERYPDTHFILAGRDVTPENPLIRELTGGQPSAMHIHLLGERTDVPQILASLDIAVSSSLSEGLPNAIGEAMACAVPCVATDVGDTATLVGDTGILVKKNTPAELCGAWDHLARMRSENRRNMGFRARDRIKALYTQEKTAASYEVLYREQALPVEGSENPLKAQ